MERPHIHHLFGITGFIFSQEQMFSEIAEIFPVQQQMQDEQCGKYQTGVVMRHKPVTMSDSQEFVHCKGVPATLIPGAGRKYEKQHTSRDDGGDKEQECTEINNGIYLSSTYHQIPFYGFKD
jgi:hypothetical protein